MCGGFGGGGGSWHGVMNVGWDCCVCVEREREEGEGAK